MQSFSPTQIAGEIWQALHTSVGTGRLAVWVIGSNVASIAAAWVASLAVAGQSATVGCALKVWFAWLGGVVVLAIAAAVGLPFAEREGGEAGGVVIPAIFFCLLVVAVVGIPMAVYGVGLLRSLGFMVIYAVLAAC